MQKFSQLLERHYKYLLVTLLVAIPLYPKFPFITVPGTYVTIRLEDILMAAVAVLITPYLWANRRAIWQRPIERAVIIYFGVGFLSLLSAVLLTKSVQIHISLLHLFRRIEYFVPFFLGVYAFRRRDPRLLEFLMKTMMLVTVALFVYGLGQRYLSWPVIITQNQEYSKGVALRWIPGSHITSTFAGHYDLSTFLVLILPVFVALLFELRGRVTRLTLLAVILCGLWLLVNAVSRVSTLSYLVAVFGALFVLKKYKAAMAVVLVSLLLFSLSTDLRGRFFRVFSIIKNKVNGVIMVPRPVYAQNNLPAQPPFETAKPPASSVTEDRSTSIRLNVEWPRALRAYAKNPLLGTGYSSITLATDNDYLRALGETGLLGLLAFVLVFFRLGTLMKKNLPVLHSAEPIERGFLAGVIGAFPGIFLNAAFIDIFEASKFATIFWLMVGVMVGVLRTRSDE